MVLYRKYRPQKFSEIVGQQETVKILTNEIKTDKIAHAYLFSGPRGTGKTTTARILAKAINCSNRKKGQAEPCNQCLSCREIIQGKSLDLIEIDAASNRGINDIRELKERIRFLPTVGRYKVFIIDECHSLTPDAFNALLKMLEEPPTYVVFILATTKIHKLPATIISRCQNFNFTKIPSAKIADYLKKITDKEKVKIPDQVLKTVAYRAEGCLRDALSLLGQVLSIGGKEITQAEAEIVIPPAQLDLAINFLDFLIAKNRKKAIEMINKLLSEGGDLEQFITDFINFLREILLKKIGVLEETHFDEVANEKLDKLIQTIDLKILIKIIERFIKVKIGFGYSEIPQLPIELAILDICQP